MSDLSRYEEHQFTPITESGERWSPRSYESAMKAAEDWPAGGRYGSGDRWDGIVEIVHEIRTVTPWIEHERLPAAARETPPLDGTAEGETTGEGGGA